MMDLVRSSPPLPPERADPPYPPAISTAISPSHSEYKAFLLLLSQPSHLHLNGTISRSSDCSRSLMWLSTECCSLRSLARDSASQCRAQSLMCPSPSPLPRSDINSPGSNNPSLAGQSLRLGKGMSLDSIPSFQPSLPTENRDFDHPPLVLHHLSGSLKLCLSHDIKTDSLHRSMLKLSSPPSYSEHPQPKANYRHSRPSSYEFFHGSRVSSELLLPAKG
ncbi:hypothetical protein AALP_AA7G135400 [Arabis alpina]|uniref:Uncharacterized protein n=1 Tax=Arabis alpina TaxID=50452 RepID=A0A087GHU4_ARAAL|nr:hypothetical protein AALP_AA7G135400 [Arabis alpina]